MRIIETEFYKLYNADCFDTLPLLDDNSIDLTLADLPYGDTTDNEWDQRLPMNDYVNIDGIKVNKSRFMTLNYEFGRDHGDALENWQALKSYGMWCYLNKLNKQSAATILFASGLFVGHLQNSNPKNFKYMDTWIKNNVSNVQNAKRQPIRITEQILIFCRQATIYNPQGLIEVNKRVANSKSAGGSNVKQGTLSKPKIYTQKYTNYPNDVHRHGISDRGWHPTQKPLPLLRKLILTYTNEKNENGGQSVVLDPTMGSGGTIIAAMSTGRYSIGIEKNEEEFNKAVERIKKGEPTLRKGDSLSVNNQLKLL